MNNPHPRGNRIALIAVVVVALAGAAPARPTFAATASGCHGTLPNHVVRPGSGFGRDGFNYGNSRLRTHLNWTNGWLRAGILPDGGAAAAINRDGSIRVKQGWWRGLEGPLVIRGRRLDGPSRAWRVNPSTFYGDRGFVPVILTFPTPGCWRVTGTLGTARLTYVVRVTKLPSTGSAPAPVCHAQVSHGVLPTWMRAGFSDARPRIAHVLGDKGAIGAVLFGWPLASPPRPDRNNKILWVPRHLSRSIAPFWIRLQLMDGNRAVGAPIRKIIPTGPGPSIVDVPTAGCWRLTLTWSGRRDTLDLAYTAPD